MTSTETSEPGATKQAGRWTRIVALLASIAITALVLVFRKQLLALGDYGYLGVFLIAVLGNATVVFPVPGMAVVFASASVLNPILVGLVAGLGEPLGEFDRLPRRICGQRDRGGQRAFQADSRDGRAQRIPDSVRALGHPQPGL